MVAHEQQVEAVVLQELLGDNAQTMLRSDISQEDRKLAKEGARTSWLRTSRSRPLSCRKRWVTSAPNATPTPRLLGARPAPGCGSLHSSSHIRPSSGGSL